MFVQGSHALAMFYARALCEWAWQLNMLRTRTCASSFVPRPLEEQSGTNCMRMLASSPGHSQFFNVTCSKTGGPGIRSHVTYVAYEG